jgi:mitochondrial fission protein ELM1
MSVDTDGLRVRVVIASDDKRGHENQSRVVARILGDTEPLVLHLRPGAADLALRLQFMLFGTHSMSTLRAADIVRRSLQPEQPAGFRAFAHEYRQAQGKLRLFTVSTGTRAAAYNLVLSRMLSAIPVVNMTPSLLPRKLFELNIVPEHDVSRERNVPANVLTTTLALGYHDTQAAQLLASRLAMEHGLDERGNYLGVCIGGPTRDIPYPAGWCEQLLRQLLAAAKPAGLRLLITTSRRTAVEDTKALVALAESNPDVAYFLDANADPLNPLPAFYELARVMAITADSYSMVSEAIHAGHTPLVLEPPGAKTDAKVVRSLERLKEKGLLNLITAGDGSTAEQLSAQLTAPPHRQQPNGPYGQLRTAVREYFSLG